MRTNYDSISEPLTKIQAIQLIWNAENHIVKQMGLFKGGAIFEVRDVSAERSAIKTLHHAFTEIIHVEIHCRPCTASDLILSGVNGLQCGNCLAEADALGRIAHKAVQS